MKLLFSDFDCLFFSNGPGDPTKCQAAINIIKRWLNDKSNQVKPVSILNWKKIILYLVLFFPFKIT